MDFSRKHARPDDSGSIVHDIYRAIQARRDSGLPEADHAVIVLGDLIPAAIDAASVTPAFWDIYAPWHADLTAPRPVSRSVWDFYGLRRRPRRS